MWYKRQLLFQVLTKQLSSVVERDSSETESGVAGGGLGMGGGASGTSIMALQLAAKPARPPSVRTSKWGRLLGSSSLDSGSESAR